MKNIKETIKYYNKFNPYLKYILLMLIFFIYLGETSLIGLVSIIALGEIVAYDLYNRHYSALIRDNSLYPIGVLYMFNGVLALGFLKAFNYALYSVPQAINAEAKHYMLYYVIDLVINTGFMMVIGSALIIAYYYVVHGTLKLDPKLKYLKDTNLLTNVLISKWTISFVIFIGTFLIFITLQDAVYSVIFQITSNHLDAFNMLSRNERTVYAFNHLANIVISTSLLYLLAKLAIKLFKGNDFKMELAIIGYLLFVNFNICGLQVTGNFNIKATIFESISIFINTFIFSQIFNFFAEQFQINGKLFKVKLPILVGLLSIIAYWPFIVGGLSLLICMNINKNIIQKFKEA